MTNLSRPRVLVFDSGVGGLSVAACIRKRLPDVEFVYLADNAGFPYGGQQSSVVIDRCCSLISKALEQIPCDVIVVACNTASTVVLPHLRALTTIPVVGVVPAVKPAAGLTVNRRIGILATPATACGQYLDNLVQKFASDCDVMRIGHPDLVRWVENSVAGTAIPQEALAQAVAGFREAGVDTVVLGCTHYPLLLGSLKQALPEVQFWVDSGDAIARRVEDVLGQSGKKFLAANPDTCQREPVVAALFSGLAPAGLAGFMGELGLRPYQITGHWSGNPEAATEAGSA
ncbi:MAG TPA: glutamate racemase [Marinobacter sp.]|nr:glutamate racemase [Marinobacter sp.]